MLFEKTCVKCGYIGLSDKFCKDRTQICNGKEYSLRSNVCLECNRKMAKAKAGRLRSENLDKQLELQRRRSAKHRQRHPDAKKRENSFLKQTVIEAYGGSCYCCGESNLAFLTVDHVNNDGKDHRIELTGSDRSGGGQAMYRWAIKHNFPSSLRIACWNCNCGRSINNNGLCPHETARQQLLTLAQVNN